MRWLAAVVVLAGMAQADTLDVPAEYPTVGAALAAAVAGDTVLVQPGTWHESVVMARPQVALVAAGHASDTILDGSSVKASTITILPSADGAVVDGFTVTGGSGSPTSQSHTLVGGGIWAQAGHVVIRNCRVTGNSATFPVPFGGGAGGGIWLNNGVVQDCELSDNLSNFGGGICGGEATVVTGCRFLRNQTVHGGSGGGIHGAHRVSDCVFEDNFASNFGGGAMGVTQVFDCTFRRNEAPAGGGLVVGLVATGCVFEDNRADQGGGAWNYAAPPGLGLTRCRFTGNHAASGGGLYIDGDGGFSVSDLADCAFVRNEAALGDGVFHESDWMEFTVRNCTFVGDGLLGEAPMQLEHCILRGTFLLEAVPLTVAWSDVEGGWPGIGNFDADPLFVDPLAGDLHLQPSSPCVDAGAPGAQPAPADELDLDGEPRVQGGHLDVGADEVTVDCNANGVPDWRELLTGESGDCDGDSLLDECEGWFDCNSNGVSDDCDIGSGLSTDCNGNDIPDECDIATGSSADIDDNGLPDECYQILKVPADQPTLLAAVQASHPGDTILLAPGIHSGQGSVNIGLETTLLIMGETTAADCIIDCEGAGRAFLLEWDADVTLRHLTIRNGVAPGAGGGAIFCDWSTNLQMRDCVLTGNSAQDQLGGALFLDEFATAVLESCTLADNEARTGGAVTVHGGTFSATRCTFSGNTATGAGTILGKGGSIRVDGAGTVTLRDSILAGGSAATGQEIHAKAAGTLVDIAFSDVAGGESGIVLLDASLVWGAGNLDADPLFKDAAGGDWRLSGGSPCIDSGDPAGEPDADGTPPDMGARPFEPFEDLGFALAGAGGTPSLQGTGTLIAGDPLTIMLGGAAPASGATLFLGETELLAPFKGGVLVPAPSLLIGPLQTDAVGGLELAGNWPAGIPSGSVFVLQAWIADAGGPHGFAASNGLAVEAR